MACNGDGMSVILLVLEARISAKKMYVAACGDERASSDREAGNGMSTFAQSEVKLAQEAITK
jgi:hypothetical protein